MNYEKKTCIIIITHCHNDKVIEATQHCFRTILKTVNMYAPNSYQILFVDNASNDKFRGWLQSLEQSELRIPVIYNQENLKFAKAANQGLLAASQYADYCILLNNDTIPRLGWLFSMIQVAASDPKIAVVGAQIVRPGTEMCIHTGTLLHNSEIIDPYCWVPRSEIPKKLVEERLWINGACMLIKSEVIKKEGVFNDTDFDLYFEEADYMMRLRQKGYRIVYDPMAVVEHHEKMTAETIPTAADSFYAKWNKLVEIHNPYWQSLKNLYALPRVNIIMPCYNCEATMRASIDSALTQSYPNYKLYIVNDGSTDNTATIAEEYKTTQATIRDPIFKANRDRIVILNKANGGVASARNHALAAINSDPTTLPTASPNGPADLIAFLDSDDIWDKTYFERIASRFMKPPTEQPLDLAFALCRKRFTDGSPAIPYGIPEVVEYDKALLMQNNYIYVSFVVIAKEAANRIGQFRGELNGVEDYDYWRRGAEMGLNYWCEAEELGTYLVRPEGNAKEGSEAKMRELKKGITASTGVELSKDIVNQGVAESVVQSVNRSESEDSEKRLSPDAAEKADPICTCGAVMEFDPGLWETDGLVEYDCPVCRRSVRMETK